VKICWLEGRANHRGITYPETK